MRVLLLVILCWSTNWLYSDHRVSLEIREIEWNGSIKVLEPVKKWDVTFRSISETFFLDSIKGAKLYVRVYYVPVYYDSGEKPAFRMLLFDSNDRRMDVPTMTQYVAGTYDAGIRQRDEYGLRRWGGKLKYTPDTSVHLTRPQWRQDDFTFQIGSYKAWNATVNSKNASNKLQKNLYFQGSTGHRSDMRSGGRFGKEDFEICIDPVRYQWDNETWMELTIRMFKVQSDGKKLEVLAHTFNSQDKNIIYKGGRRQNAYEIRDAKNKYYMLLTDVMIIPY